MEKYEIYQSIDNIRKCINSIDLHEGENIYIRNAMLEIASFLENIFIGDEE